MFPRELSLYLVLAARLSTVSVTLVVLVLKGFEGVNGSCRVSEAWLLWASFWLHRFVLLAGRNHTPTQELSRTLEWNTHTSYLKMLLLPHRLGTPKPPPATQLNWGSVHCPFPENTRGRLALSLSTIVSSYSSPRPSDSPCSCPMTSHWTLASLLIDQESFGDKVLQCLDT